MSTEKLRFEIIENLKIFSNSPCTLELSSLLPPSKASLEYKDLVITPRDILPFLENKFDQVDKHATFYTRPIFD
jgi:hypothetical protein